MRPRLLHMISPVSLSAFSASATNGVVSVSGAVSPSPAGRIPPLNPLRTTPQGGNAPSIPSSPPPGVAPGQRMPRGSLLNLSV